MECAVLKATGALQLTGKLGDVMQESAKAALSWVRAHCDPWGIPADFFKQNDIHIHVPEGAVPKDGPSAGVTLVTALVSALTSIPVRAERGHDGRNHPARSGAAHRRPQGKADGGIPRGCAHGAYPQRKPQGPGGCVAPSCASAFIFGL